MNNHPPAHLVNLLSVPKQRRSRCTVYLHYLIVPRTPRKYCGDRILFVAGPKLWNRLPNKDKNKVKLWVSYEKASRTSSYNSILIRFLAYKSCFKIETWMILISDLQNTNNLFTFFDCIILLIKIRN